MEGTESTDMLELASDGDWSCLPHVVLSQIFQNLASLDRICASNVCNSWYVASCSKDSWTSFDVANNGVKDWKFDLQELQYSLIQTSVSELKRCSKAEICNQIYLHIINKFGKYIQNLRLNSDATMSDELFMSLHRECSNLKSIHLENIYHGRFQETTCSLLQKNRTLESIVLVNVKFISKNEPLPVGLHHALTLKKLYLVNSFQSYNLGTLMYLVNLKELSIEPQLLSYSLLYHLAGHSLTDLYIVGISKITGFYQEAMQDWHWKEICKQGPNFRVHFRFSSAHEWTEKEIILKPSIPVKSLIYYKYRLVHFIPLRPLILQYSSTLEVFVDFSIAMASYVAAHSDKDIAGMNKCLLNLVQTCQNLRVFAVKEVLASSTLLAMVTLNRNLQELYVMQDQVIYENLTDTLCLPDGIVDIIKENWIDKKFVTKMSDVLGKQWQPLRSEEYFKKVARLCNNFI